MKTYYLVDGDNDIGTGLKGIDLLTPEDNVLIFHQKGIALTKIKKLCVGSRANIQYIESVKSGRNSIDFQIITELGVLVGRREADFAYVISQDKGYEASISALQSRFADSFREVALRPSIEDCLPLVFLLAPHTRQELCAVLRKEYGSHGQVLYDHLAQLFHSPDSISGAPEITQTDVRKAPEVSTQQGASPRGDKGRETPISGELKKDGNPVLRPRPTHRRGIRKKKATEKGTAES